ncbi:MAG: hypothetical protein EP346_00075 [Bacteroidetes bacterium]|nr:MAG: hypothetical protein EP346_00075 [Bacteroidota bacterium]
MGLLNLRAKGRTLPLPPGQVVTFIEESPVFSTQFQGGDYSLSFGISETPEVNEVFGYAKVPNVITPKQVRIPAQIGLSSGVWKNGDLVLQKFNGKYRGYFQSGVSSALSQILDKPLNSLEFDDYSFSDARDHAKTVAQNPFDYDYCFFPVHSNGYSSNPLWKGVINQFDVTTNEFVQNSSYTSSGEYEFETVLTPFPRLIQVYKKIFDQLGLKLDAPVFDGDMVRRICLLSSNSLSQEVFLNPNYRIDAKSSFNLAEFLPSISVNDFLIEVNNTLGCSLSFNPETGVYQLRRRSVEILNNSKIYQYNGVLLEASPILEGRKDLYFKFRNGSETFVPFTQEELIDPDIRVPNMTFESNQNAFIWNSQPASSYIPSIELSMRSVALDIGSSDGDNEMIWAIYDGLTGSSISFQFRPYGYPQAHGRKMADLLLRFDHFVGTLEWEGVSNMDNPSAPKNKNGLYYQRWEEWTEFERNSQQIEVVISPTVEDVINATSYEKIRIENYTILIKSREIQISDKSARVKITGYLI